MIPPIPHVPAIDWGLHEDIEKGRDVTHRPFLFLPRLSGEMQNCKFLRSPLSKVAGMVGGFAP